VLTGADDEGFQRRAPTLYVIIVIKLLKFALFVGLAICLYAISDDDRPAEYQQVLHFLHLNPEQRFWADLAVKVGHLTEAGLLWTAVGTLCYSLFSLVEGVGMIFRGGWAGWLAIGESAFFIPIEVLEMIHHFSWVVVDIFAFNVFIVWYLYQNRHRLFHHATARAQTFREARTPAFDSSELRN
jgi:uncharacterized membrane protein (DUF2068 family)